MKRFLASALILGVTMLFTGCGDTSEVKSTETVKAPGGETKTTDSHKVESSGSNAPTNTAGEKPESK